MSSIINSLNNTRFEGLQYTVYKGYMGSTSGGTDNVNYFSTASLYTSSTTGSNKGLVPYISSLNVGTNNCVKSNSAIAVTNISVEWLGYFKSNYTGTWTFYLNSDDCSYLWIGDKAISGYTINNVVVSYPGIHALNPEKIGQKDLVSNTYYPIRIQLGQNVGGVGITIAISNPNLTKTYTPLGYFYFFNNGILNP